MYSNAVLSANCFSKQNNWNAAINLIIDSILLKSKISLQTIYSERFVFHYMDLS